MRIVFVALLLVHGAIHLLGAAKGLGLAEVAQLTQPISRSAGVLWLLASILFAATAVAFLVAPRAWWIVGAIGVVLSQGLVVANWRDARFGTVANVIVLIPIAIAMLDRRSTSLRSSYDRDVATALSRPAPVVRVTEQDLEPFPPVVRAWLRRVGVVGRPRIRGVRGRFRARMRSNRNSAWMSATVEQYDFFDPPARFFFMRATRAGVPFDAYHRYAGPHATMQVRIAGLFSIVDARGPEMDRSETVTLFNDMCLMAPASLIGAPVQWETLDERTVRATYTNAGQTIRADLRFDAAGDLVGFESLDRSQSADGKSYRTLPWSTPVESFANYHGLRLMQAGEARWREPTGEWAYGRFETIDLEMIPAG